MSYPRLWNSETSLVDENDHNAIVKYFPVKGVSYIIRLNGSSYEAINGDTGRLDYSEDTLAAVKALIVTALPSGTGLVIDKSSGIDTYLFYKSSQVILTFNANGSLFAWGGLGSPPPYLSDTMISRLSRKNFTYLDRMEVLGDWSVGGTATADTDTKVEGTQSIKLTATNLAASSIQKTVALNLTGKHLRLWFKTDNIDNVRAFYVKLRTSDPNWTDYFINTYYIWPGSKKQFTDYGLVADFYKSTFSSIGTPDWADIRGVQLEMLAEANVTGNMWVDDWRIMNNRFKGKVTLRFDDFTSTYTDVKPILDKYGYRGVFACVRDRAGVDGPTLTQLQEMYAYGWDIVCHGTERVLHNLSSLAADEREPELQNIKQYLIENGMERGARFYVPPSHVIPDYTCMQLIQKYFLACNWKDSYAFNSLPPPNPYWLQSKLCDAQSLVQMEALIDTALAENTWAILYFHGAHANLEDLCDYINTNSVEVVTFSDVFDDYDLELLS